TVALLVRRWRRESSPERQAGAPVLWAGSAMFAALAISVGNDIFDHLLDQGQRGRGRSCSRRSRLPCWPYSCSGGLRAAPSPDSWSSSATAPPPSTCAKPSAAH